MRKFSLLPAFAAISTVLVACGGPANGIGQGQPAYPERSVSATPRLPLQINAVFVAFNTRVTTYTDSTLGYVEISNQGTTAIDFSQFSLSLVSAQAVAPLDPTVITSLQTPLAANSARPLPDAALLSFSQGLTYPTDQVAIVDDAFVVHAYLAWGTAAPTASALPPLTVGALQSGAIAAPTDAFVTTSSANPALATSTYIP